MGRSEQACSVYVDGMKCSHRIRILGSKPYGGTDYSGGQIIGGAQMRICHTHEQLVDYLREIFHLVCEVCGDARELETNVEVPNIFSYLFKAIDKGEPVILRRNHKCEIKIKILDTSV